MSSLNSFNKAMLLGRLGKEPELKHTPSGIAICSFPLATSEKIKKDEEWEERTEWHNILVFGWQAKSCAKFLEKGSMVFIEGKIQTRKYKDKNENDRYVFEIVAENIKFIENKKEKYKQENKRQDEINMDGINDDDLPF